MAFFGLHWRDNSNYDVLSTESIARNYTKLDMIIAAGSFALKVGVEMPQPLETGATIGAGAFAVSAVANFIRTRRAQSEFNNSYVK